jgi:beta-lactamase class C
VFEAALVARAAERGELKLNDSIKKYVTELNGAYISKVTVGELAAHTSGLLLPTDHPPWLPGGQRIYTHAGYVLLQLVLERRYGRPITELIERNITAPLGMLSTLVPERGPDDQAIMAPDLLDRAVQGYGKDGDAIGLPGNQQGYFDFPGTGQMFSSPRDLALMLAACLGERPIDPKLHVALQVSQHTALVRSTLKRLPGKLKTRRI